MDILMVAAELAPYVRETHAGDGVAALAKALRQLGHDVTIAVPNYSEFAERGLLLARRLTPLKLPGDGEVVVLDAQLPSGAKLTLFDAPVLYQRSGVYAVDGEPFADNAARFAFLSRAAAALIQTQESQGRTFDVVHLHDWPAGLVPLFLSGAPGPSHATVLTVHDVQRQGSFAPDELENMGLGAVTDAEETLRLGQRLNVLKSAMLLADRITAPSDSYAERFVDAEYAGELAKFIREADKPVTGILGGIDYAHDNPATDTFIESRYDAEDFSNKGRNKSALLRELDLDLEMRRPLVAALGQLDPESGLDAVVSALPSGLKNDLACVVVAAGVGPLKEKVEALARRHPDTCAVIHELTPAVLHRLMAAADFYLSAAPHEPSGEMLMRAQRYGALPIALAAGAARDVVVDCDADLETGTGFLFEGSDPKAVVGALQRGLSAYVSPAWPRLVRRVMRRDLGWDRPVRRYVQLYRQALASKG